MVDCQNLSRKALTDYLIEHPQEVTENILKTLDKDAWARLLIQAPQWGTFCPWQKFNGGCWERLLKQQPQFAKYCNWGKLNSANWGGVLRGQIQFADLCPWQSLEPVDYAYILQKQPQFIDCCPEKLSQLTNLMWICLLQKQPSFITLASCSEFGCEEWGELLFHQPVLEKYCPWEQLTIPPHWAWRSCLFDHPHWAEKVEFRIESSLLHDFLLLHPKYTNSLAPEKIPSQTKKALFLKNGTFPETFAPQRFSGSDWSTLLQSLPEYASQCPWDKLSGKDWENLLLAQVQFYPKCDWEKLTDNQISRLLNNNFKLALHIPPHKLCHGHWSSLLKHHPELLLIRDGSRFFASQNHEAWCEAKIWDIGKNGLLSLYELFHNFFTARIPPIRKIFADLTECDGATFLIYRRMEAEHGKRFFKEQFQHGNWAFIEEVFDLAPEVVNKIIGKKRLPVLLVLAGSNSLLQKYLTTCNAAAYRDENGNTLLHTALLRAAYINISALFDPDNPYRQRYDYLITQGCDPEIKNNNGFSCNDLLAVLKENIDLFSEIINSDYYKIEAAQTK